MNALNGDKIKYITGLNWNYSHQENWSIICTTFTTRYMHMVILLGLNAPTRSLVVMRFFIGAAGCWWRRARFTLQLVSFKRNMQAGKPWLLLLLLLLLKCYINDYGNEFWKRSRVSCIDLHDNCGRQQRGMRKCTLLEDGGDLIARAGSTLGGVDPFRELSWATPSCQSAV